jgi:hypothetical protein
MKSAWKILSSIILLYLLGVVLLQPYSKEPITIPPQRQAGEALSPAYHALRVRPIGSSPARRTPPLVEGPIVSQPVTPHISPAVKDLPKYELEYHLDREINPRLNLNPNLEPNFRSPGGLDPLLSLQANVPQELADGFTTPILSFEGQGFTGVNPPDTVGEVGPNHYIQIINSGGGAVMVIYDKDGNVLAGPTALASLGTGVCAKGLGDGIPLYDRLAERWMISEFSGAANALCVYISQGPDAVNDGWYAYQFDTPNFPDYPKYGVWPDAYYASTNEGGGPAVYAFDRNQMLTGGAASSQRFTASRLTGFGFQALTPSDLDGATPPPAGSPNYFMRHRDDEVHNAGSNHANNDFLELWAFDVDFDTAANSSFTQIADIEIAEIDSDLCGLTSFNCFPQPGSNTTLAPLREVVMWRLQYRNFGSHEVLLGNLVTDVDGSDHGGIRWFELRKPALSEGSGNNAWSLFQEGTFAPDEHHRWMGSVAMDGSGNMALGYSISSNTISPGIRYVGRLAGDTAGTMPHGEVTLVNGSGSNASNRWGDYSSMNVDPADDCTFWYTNMYSPSTTWSTHIATFKFDSCGEDSFTLSASPDSQDICLANDATYTISVGKTGDFEQPVTLSASGNLDETTFNFSVNPTPNTPAVTSTLTISYTDEATAGSYEIEVMGRAEEISKTTTVALNLFEDVPNAPTLTAPADEATDISLQPTLSWNGVAQSTSYYLEVASDMVFSNTVYSASVDSTSHALTSQLTSSTTYYWRVRADNSCGEGELSDSRSFTTTTVEIFRSYLPIISKQ